jgi:hypothetical protein
MKPLDQLIADIAREHFGIPTLETRRPDRLDFHDVAVWQVKSALTAAYCISTMRGSTLVLLANPLMASLC